MIPKMKPTPAAPVLYILPLNDNGTVILEHKRLMDELLQKKAVFDHHSIYYPNTECIVAFYDDYSSQNPYVVKAFLGNWEFIGYTFETAQDHAFKFTPSFEVDVFLDDSDYGDLFPGFILRFYKFNNTKNLSIEKYDEECDSEA